MPVISVLHLEDSPLDAELAAARLAKDGIDCRIVRTDTRDSFLTALRTDCYDVILSDYALPQFDGASALALAQEICPEVPFIFVSGKLGEDIAIDTLKQGATDYVLKQRLDRLVPAINRALTEAQERAQRRLMEAELQQRHAEIQQLNEQLQRAMTETHHRVKNNLQIIAAMIDMQTMEAKDMLPVGEFQRLSRQVQTLATVHDILTHKAKKDGQANAIDARALLGMLIPLLQNVATGNEIRLYVNHDTQLTARQGTSLALALNELVSNAIKHGKSDVEVSFDVKDSSNAQQALLRVRDYGDGFAPDFDFSTMAHTGLELIESLARWDLGGSLTYGNDPGGGAVVTICLPL